jgi:calcium-dependent protein kinase
MASVFETIDQTVNQSFKFWRHLDELAIQDFSERKIHSSSLQFLSPSSSFKTRSIVLTPTRIYKVKHDRPKKMSIVTWKKLEAFCEASDQEERFGFRLTQGGIFQDFYSKNPKELEDWLDALSKVAILNDLEEDYAIIKEIGSGNYAKVYLAQDVQDHKQYAVKSISKEAVMNSNRTVNALISEINIMRKLDHPYLLKLHRVYENDKFIHLILDYLPGGDLFHRIIEKSNFSEEDSIKFMKNLLEALDYMHSLNFIHRDLKPENILLTRLDCDYDFKIADFGLACECKEDQLLRCGSPGYVAPEILKKMTYNKKVDIFSAGIILYVMLSSRAPFFGKTQNEILMRNKECKIYFQDRYWKNVSREGIDCVLRLTDSDPEARPSARDALKHVWFSTSHQPRPKMASLTIPESNEAGISAELMRRMNRQRGPDGLIKKEEEEKKVSEVQRNIMNQNAKNLLSKLRDLDPLLKK